jgi:hypothetical protein
VSFVKPDGTADAWYVSKEKNSGFTADSEMALKDSLGRPIIADGHMRKLVGRMMDVPQERLRQLWSYYLDLMENFYDLQEKVQVPVTEIQSPMILELVSEQRERAILVAQEEMRGVRDALCIMEYGWLFSKEPDQAREIIRKQAEIRYNMESE